MNRQRIGIIALLILLIGALSMNFVLAQQSDTADELQVINIEVAEDGNRFIFDEAPVFEDGMPAFGNGFVTQGYIYPEGTLNGSNGVLPNGEAEFPELVLGEWTCYGYFIGDGAYTETGAVVATTQIYQFNESYDNAMFTTIGYELADFEVEIERAFSGGTGQFNTAHGEVFQTLHGFTEQMGVNLSVEVRFE